MTPEELLKQKIFLDTQVRSYEIEAEQARGCLHTIRSWGSIAREDDSQNEERSKIVAQFSHVIIETIVKLDAFKERLMNLRTQYICSRNISGKGRPAVDQLIYNISEFFTRASHVEVSLQSFCRELQNIASSGSQGFDGSFFSRSRRHTVPDYFPCKPERRGHSYSIGGVPKSC